MVSTILLLELNIFARPQEAQQLPSPEAAPSMPPGRQSVDEWMEQMSKDLNLTQEQREKIRPLLEELNKQMRLLHNATMFPEQ